MAVQIKLSELTAMVNNGAKKEEIASKYNLTSAATSRLLKDANLKIKKTHKPTYQLVNDNTPVVDTVESPSENVK